MKQTYKKKLYKNIKIDKVIALNINVDYWYKYIGYMASDYRDIWIDHYNLEDNDYNDCKFNELLELNKEYKQAKELLQQGEIDYIALRCDID